MQKKSFEKNFEDFQIKSKKLLEKISFEKSKIEKTNFQYLETLLRIFAGDVEKMQQISERNWKAFLNLNFLFLHPYAKKSILLTIFEKFFTNVNLGLKWNLNFQELMSFINT